MRQVLVFTHERLFRTNSWGVVNASRAAIKHLPGGAFITVASVVADLAGTGGRERSNCEPTLTHSLYTDVSLRGGWNTKLVLLGLAALGFGYIVQARRSPTRAARALHRG